MTESRISKWLILSVASGLVSILGVWSPKLLLVAVFSVLCAVMVFRRRCARRSTRVMAAGTILMSSSVFAGGSLWHFARFRSEAPPGFERVHFGRTFELSRSIPKGVQELIGRPICLKGYASRHGGLRMTTFALSPDGAGSVEQLVGVVLREGDSWDWHRGPVAVSGTLTLNPDYSSDQVDVRYLLTDAIVRDSKTPLGVLPGPLGSCYARRPPPEEVVCFGQEQR